MKPKIDLPRKFKSVWQNERVYLKVPKEFCIYPTNKNHVGCNAKVKKTFEYFYWINKLIFEHECLLHLDFSDLVHMGRAASVVLFAEITKAQLVTQNEDVVIFTFPIMIQLKICSEEQIFKKRFRQGDIESL